MHLRSIVQRWWTKLVQPRKKASPISNKAHARLRVEELETRTVMSTTDGSFNTVMLNALRGDSVYSAITGTGITIANIDTGLFFSNPDLQANVIAYYDAVVNTNPFTDAAMLGSSAQDPDGHGTATAGIAASSNPNIGVAYGAKIVAIRAIPAGNEPLPNHDPILTSLQWVYANADRYAIKVVNLSFGLYTTNENSVPALDRIGLAIRDLEARGIAVVIGSGDNYASFATPGVAAPSSFGTFTVASTWAKNETFYNAMISSGAFDSPYWATETQVAIDQLAAVSQRSQLANQIAAPGQEIYTTWTSTTRGLNGDLLHNIVSGTGMAAPLVSGMIALMQQAAQRFGGRYLTIQEIQNIVTTTSDTITDSNVATNGRIENGQTMAANQNLPETGLTYKRINIYEAVKAVRTLVMQASGVVSLDVNNTVATAINLGNINGTVNFTQTGNVSADGLIAVGATDVDLYKVTLTSPGKLLANINPGTGSFYPYLRLFNSAGTQIDTNYSAGPPESISTGFRTNADLPIGTYYVGVSALNNSNYNINTGTGSISALGTGAYQLTLSLSNADPDGVIPGAFPLTGNVNALTRNIGTDPAPINSTTPNVNGAKDVDMYQFVAPDNGTLTVTIDSTGFAAPLDATTRLFDDLGNQLAIDGGGFVVNQLVVPNLIAGRTYYIGVSDWSNSTYDAFNPNGRSAIGPGGSYKISTAFDNGDVDGTVATAFAASIGVLNGGVIGSDNGGAINIGAKDVDFYRFQPTTAGVLVVSASGFGGFVPFLTLWKLGADSSHIIKVATTVRGSQNLYYVVAPGDTIFASVTGFGNENYLWSTEASGRGGTMNSYLLMGAMGASNELSVRTDNQALADGNPAIGVSTIAVNDIVYANLGRDAGFAVGSRDVDLYKFTATTTQTLNFHVDLSAEFSGNTFLRFFNSAGVELKYTGDGDPSNTHKDLRVQVVAGQTYYFGVTGFGANARTYNPLTGANASSASHSMGSYVFSLFAIAPAGQQATDQPTFNWAPVDDASSYTLLVANLTTNAIVINQSGITATSRMLGVNEALTPGHNYVWYVGALTSNGVTTYSGGLNFSIAPLASPAQFGPIGNVAASAGYDRPTFTWGAVANAGHYYLYVVDKLTNLPVINQPVVNGLSYTATANEALTPGREYLWYAIAVSTNGQAIGYDTAGKSFTLANLPAPTLNGPSGTIAAAANYDLPTFQWSNVPAAHHYWLYVFDVTTNKAVIDQKTLTTLTYTPTTALEAMTPRHNYIWYVISYSTNGQGFAFNPGQTFNLANLPAPTLNGPAGTIAASAGYDLPTFQWSNVPAAHHYWLYVFDVTTNKAVIDQKTLTTLTYTPTTAQEALTPGHNFIWYVISYSTNGQGLAFNPGQTFTLAGLPAPTLTGPSGAIAASAGYDTPTFNWSNVPAAHHYWLYVLDTTTNQAALSKPDLVGTFTYTPIAAEGLTPGHNFIWYVISYSTNGQGFAFNPGQTFSLATLPSPTLTSPIGTTALDVPTFTWTSVPAATKYAIYLFDVTTNQPPASIVMVNNSASPSWTPSTPLVRGRTYRWWVASVSANGAFTFVANQKDFTVDL